ncbi:sperm-associated antigen 17 isoform X2 [Dunckerocampus dactyliophorus]|uniref:sperm-associated antigen 17 isoform X2 n=1 Tax=Dunckerocampus dactyliophorus TaxID=161453 RepID=UPI002405536E|nr:sperm-associated antigen 17 isoform X2 [Dunckerocampus dactyliophorus]
MAPKAAKKDKAKKAPATQGPDTQTWESGLANAQFEEEQWHACVCLVVGKSPDDEDLMPILTRAVQQPQRKLFSSLTWEHTEAKIGEYGNPKAKKRESFPQFYEVTGPAKELLDAKEEIPAELMSQIVKFMLLQIKDGDHQRRKAEQSEETSASTKEKAGPKGKDKKLKEEPPAKPKTKLKRRDDVEPPKYIDDEPDDGPQHYILLLGFHQPDLVGTLDAAGVHVSNVIMLSATHHAPCDEEQQEEEQETSEADTKSDDAAAREKWAAQAKVLDNFWSGLRQVLDNGGANSRLHNVAQLEYTVPDILMTIDMQDPEAVMGLATEMFEGVANLIYDCLDWRRQHQHYIDATHFIAVPSVITVDHSQPPEPPPVVLPQSKKSGRPPPPKKVQLPLTTDVDMHHYNSLLDHVPAEACSVPLILHCMLEQVVLIVLSSEQPPQPQVSESQPQNVPPLDHQLVGQMLHSVLPVVQAYERRHLLHSLLSTVNSEEDKEMIKEQFEETPKKFEHPVIIRHHDERALRLIGVNGIQGFDPGQVEASMMRWSPVWKLIASVAQRHTSSCWRAIKQQLQHQCTDDEVSWPQVERFIHQSVFESMQLTAVDEDGVLGKDSRVLGMVESVKKHPIIPWDNPLSFAKKNLRKKRPKFVEDTATTELNERQVDQLSLADIQSCRQRSLLNWHYVEHYDAAILPQVLQSAAQQYRCLDTLRGSHNSVMYIFCHNPINPNRLCNEFWDVDLHTDVKFRMYLEHVADNITEWIEKEELKRQRQQSSHVNRAEAPRDSLEDEDESKEPFITKDSLKASLLEEERLKEEEAKKTKKSGKAATSKGKQQMDEQKSVESKKSDKSTAAGGKSNSSSALTSDQSLSGKVDDKEEPSTGFTGFQMDGMLIHLSGRLQYLFPSDGGHVTVETINYMAGSSMLKVAVRKDGHHFYTHISHVVHAARTDIKEHMKMTTVKRRSFSALLDNGVQLSYSFYGPTGEYKESHMETERGPQKSTEPKPGLNSSTADTPKSDNGPAEVSEGQAQESSSPFRSLNLSLPSGLLLQFMRDEEEQSMLVRLSFHTQAHQHPSLSKEASRTITSHGAVIRYMKDGSSEVLFADGSVSTSSDSGPVWVKEIDRTSTDVHLEQNSEETPPPPPPPPPQGFWTTTTPSGVRISTIGTTHEHNPTTALLTYKTSDPVTQDMMLSREDLVVSVQKPDGSLKVEHADGTRITTLYHDRSPSMQDDKELAGETAAGSPETPKETKEKVVLVENEACATVVMYPERHMAEIWLVDGTIVTGNNKGAYQIVPSSIGLLQIQSHGKFVYTSGPPQDASPSYIMSHTDPVTCGVTDLDGNHFQVLEDGQVTVHNIGPPPCMLQEEEEEDEEGKDNTEMSMSHVKDRGHYPRLFLVHDDGSGFELLSSQTVAEVLYQAHLDPTVALLKDLLPDTQDEFGITILKPSHESVRSKWVQGRQNLDVMPQNLSNRGLHDFPCVERSSSSFETTTVQNRVGCSAVSTVDVQNCPKVLEIRELYQHRAITRRLKNIVDMRLKEYIDSLMGKAQWSADVMLKEPRTEEERVHAGVLLTQSLTEEKDECCTFESRTPGDFGSLYSQAMQPPDEVLDVSEDPAVVPSVSCEVKESKWIDRLEQYRQELFEVKACIDALRKRIVVPYFDPENISVHQNLLHHASPDIWRPSLEVPTFPGPDDTEEAHHLDMRQDYTAWPSIPTPTHSASQAAVRRRTPGVRPPTAGQSSWMDFYGPLRSAQVDVSREPRQMTVRLPSSIVSSKPYSVPNYHFRSVEDPVRRRCRTISLADPGAVIRGFELRPSSIDFGTQKEGTSSAITVVMKNVGVDTCRFHVKQPPISSGLRVKYHPGPVPAGLHVELQIELFAMCQVHEGYMDSSNYIFQDIVIRTETDILYLPVMAIILPDNLYDMWLKDQSGTRSKKHCRAPKQSSSLPAGQQLGQNSPSAPGACAAAHTGHHKRIASL